MRTTSQVAEPSSSYCTASELGVRSRRSVDRCFATDPGRPHGEALRHVRARAPGCLRASMTPRASSACRSERAPYMVPTEGNSTWPLQPQRGRSTGPASPAASTNTVSTPSARPSRPCQGTTSSRRRPRRDGIVPSTSARRRISPSASTTTTRCPASGSSGRRISTCTRTTVASRYAGWRRVTSTNVACVRRARGSARRFRHQTGCGCDQAWTIGGEAVADTRGFRHRSGVCKSYSQGRRRGAGGEDRAHPIFYPDTGTTHPTMSPEHPVLFSPACH